MVALRAPEAPSIIGERYGRLTVISILPPDGQGRRVLCRCDCGAEPEARVRFLLSGKTRSCGCLKRELATMPQIPRPPRDAPHPNTAAKNAVRRDALIAAGMFTQPQMCHGCEQKRWGIHRETHLCVPCMATTDVLTCDCGEPKGMADEACSRCTYLDGEESYEARLISAFRVLGEVATLDLLVEDMGVDERTVYRALSSLRARGRVNAVVPMAARDTQIDPARLRYVPASVDPSGTSERLARGGYYVHTGPKMEDGEELDTQRCHAATREKPLYVLMNRRRTA